MESFVKLESVESVKEFVRLTALLPVSATLKSDRYTVDAKSLLGVFSLNLSEPVQILVDGKEALDDETKELFKDFLAA